MSRGAALAGRVAAGVLVAVGGVQLAVLECFLLPLRVGGVPVPLSIPAAVLGNLWLPALSYRVSGSRLAAASPVLVWLAVVILAALPRPEGDLIVPGTLRGIGLLVLGALAGAYALGRVLAAPRGSVIGVE